MKKRKGLFRQKILVMGNRDDVPYWPKFKAMDLLTFGERSLNLKRAINNKLGITRKDDHIPDIARKALNEGGTAGIEPDMDMMLREFYTVSNWDWDTRKPKKEKLVELGLGYVAKDLYA